MLAELTPAVQAKERSGQPLMYGVRFDVPFKQRVLLTELGLKGAQPSQALVPILNQETAVVFTPLATVCSATAR